MSTQAPTGPATEAPAPGDYALPSPEPGAPNVVVIVLDDVGFAQLGCFGSGIATPHIDRLASEGLRYNRFHVTALCSPTRACLLTGRNHHAVGMGFLSDLPLALPGYTARIPKSAGTLPRLLRDAGYNTMAVGKWHLVPGGERTYAGPFDRWPLGYGFERFYGFLGGDTNQWSPHLVRDNEYVDPPRSPADGYHLSEDLADQAIRYVNQQQQAAPQRPFFLSFALGAMHAPHHVAPEWVESYRGRFDQGWERWREEVFTRQLDLGIVPAGTTLGERPAWIQDWAQLPADAQKMLARQQEVFAGFLSHTDAQIGRVVTELDDLGILDDTIILLISDNGASGEGGALGTHNEHRFSARLPETVEENLAWSEELGGVHTYPHYSWGWAWAGNTPLRLWKRYTWLGGTRTPLIVHWPAGIKARGEIRDQFAHVVDLMPTILDVCGVAAPEILDGVVQQHIDGASLRDTFDDASAPAPRDVQYFEMLGSRSIIADGWKATTDHVSKGVVDEELLLEGSRSFDDDTWALFRMADDFAEAHDLGAQHPEVLAHLEQLWADEAESNHVLPIADDLLGRLASILLPSNTPGTRCVYRPAGGPVPDESIPRFFGDFTITADVVTPEADANGVLWAIGDWTGGCALYARDGHLVFALNRAGDAVNVVTSRAISSGAHTLACTYTLDPAGPQLTVLEDDEVIEQTTLPVPVPIVWQHGGTMLTLGYDRGLPVSDDYDVPFPWTGVLHEVVIETGRGVSRDLGAEIGAALRNE